VEALHAQGAYGAVYRAVRVGHEQEGPVALKLSLYPWDRRFAREGELLSRLSHPGIPRLLGRGVLRHASGAEHPWFVMEWVEGIPLYEWAVRHVPSYRQGCQVLAQLARALEALHAAGAVHRDVKGDNVLVQLSDRRAVLIDLGSCHFQGAPRLTWQALAPGTPAYQSSQAGMFHIRCARERDIYYAPTPADDLFALGVTAYRLVMGAYPPSMNAREDEQGGWYVWSPDPRPLLEMNSRVEPVLREWILRLLSDVPEERGSAAELAAALEAEVEERKEVARPVEAPAAENLPPVTPVAASVLRGERHAKAQERKPNWSPWLALAAAVAVVAVLLPWGEQRPEAVSWVYVQENAPGQADAYAPDAGTADVGDSEPAEDGDSAAPPSEERPIAQEPPPDLRQKRPTKKGKCPGRTQVLINGGCWVEQAGMTAEACVENGYVMLDGKCYAPALEVPRKKVPTSGPGKAR
jgi:predicted Ser/Thr protein kinase